MAIYYVAIDGSDLYTHIQAQNVSTPWATWQKAFNEASAGDIVYIRGGVYAPTSKAYGWGITVIWPDLGYGRNGTLENPICYYVYPPDWSTGNYPILDCSLASNSAGNLGLNINEATNIKFKGLTIRNVKEVSLGPNIAGIYASMCGNLSFENMHVHDIQGEGIWIRGYDNLNLINCDSHDNFDPLGDITHTIGGMGDGFLISSRATSYEDGKDKIANIYGCRAWHCSDDGFDMNVQQLYMDRCWSFVNGASIGGPGGIGFKTNTGLIRDPGQKIYRNCITAYNNSSTGGGQGIGFTNFENTTGTILSYHNNFSYCDDRLTSSVIAWDFNINNFNNQFANNIAYRTTASYIASFEACGATYQNNQYAHLTNNTFRLVPGTTVGQCQANPVFSLSDADFLSLDVSELKKPRKSDGSLPDVSFGHLAPGSDLIKGGINLGLSTDGDGHVWKNPPSIGAFEYDYDSSNLSITVTTTSITDISSYTATSGGNVTHDGSIALTYRGICWRTSENPTVADSSSRDTSTGEGSYVSYLTGLNANTQYHVKAFAYNSDGIAYGQDVSFYSAPGIPTIVTIGITDSGTLTTTSASCYTHLMNDGSSGIIARGICWSTSSSPTISNSHTHDSSALGAVVSSITGLNSSTHYFIRAYATNAYGTAYGLDGSFNTLDTSTHAVPDVSTLEVSDISTNSAVGSGNVTHDGSISLTYRGICISTNINPTTLDVSVRDTSTGEGSYSLNLTSLNSSTHYHVRAFAYNWYGTSYGIDVSFNTLASSSDTSTSAIVANHTIVDDYGIIPAYYISEVKKMYLSVPGESHAEAYRTGLANLKILDPTYDVCIGWVPPESYTEEHLRANYVTWGNVDNSTGWITSYGEEDWFTSATAISRTKLGFKYCYDSSLEISAVGFGWCWDPAIDTSAEYTTYISATEEYVNYCSSMGYNTNVFFTTGPVDGMNATGELGYNKYRGHEYIRNYVNASDGLILFDYADILCYDDNGDASTTSWNGNTYPIIATSNLGAGDVGHIDASGALRLAKAMWWLLARTAGWDGLPESSTSSPTVTTSLVTDISLHDVSVGGNVTSDGSVSLTYRGICWSTSSTPVITDSSLLDSSTGEGIFTLNLGRLSTSTNYHVRAFAYNSVGLSYGSDVSFNTSSTVQILTIEGSSGAVATGQGYPIPRTVPTLLAFRNNNFSSSFWDTYLLQSGDDSYNINQSRNLDNAIITGNYLFYSGTPGSNNLHGIMAGYNTNYNIKYNYEYGLYYPIVIEGGYNDGSTMINTSGGFCYNIFNNCITLAMGGMENVYIYNNIMYTGIDTSGGDIVRIGYNNGTTTYAPSKNVKIKNNIFYSKTNGTMIHVMPNCEEGFECDYNVYFVEDASNNEPRFEYNGSNVTWAQWQSLGFDTHSYVINPSFIDTSSLKPSSRLNYGINLGSNYNYGLASDASWILNVSPTIVQQDSSWQVGAYVLFDISSYSVPIVNTSSLTDISINTAIAHGVVVHDGFISLTYRGFCVSTASSPTTVDASFRDISTGEGSYNITLTSLSSSTHYFVRAFAYNSEGTAYGTDVSFNTLPADASTPTSTPFVDTSTIISNISYYTATAGGNVTHDGSIVLVYRGICVSVNSNPLTLDVSFNDVSTGEGSFTIGLSGLSTSTHYHIRAFAYNSVGTSYGTDVSFNTLSVPNSSTTITYIRSTDGKFLTLGSTYFYIPS